MPALDTRPQADLQWAAVARDRLDCACGERLPMQVRLGLRSRTRPVFEGRWCCGVGCLQIRVAAAVRREAAPQAVRRMHRHRMPLGLVLLATGAVSHGELMHALATQRQTGERVGDVLARECGLTEHDVARALATQWGCSVWNVGGVRAAAVAAIAPRSLWQSCGMLPVRIGREHRLGVAFAEAVDAQAVFALQQIHKVPVSAGIAARSSWATARDLVAMETGVTTDEVDVPDLAAIERHAVRLVQRLQPVESRFVRAGGMYWMRLWLEMEALAGGPESTEDVLDVVYRIP